MASKKFPRRTTQATKRSGFTNPKSSKARHSHGKRSAGYDTNRFAK